MSVFTCFAWGCMLYLGNLETLWRMLGISNQLLASIALAVGTTYLLTHAPKRRYALCTAIPFCFVVVTVFTAGLMSIQGWWRELASVPESQVLLIQLACGLAALMLLLTGVIVISAVWKWYAILAGPRSPAAERSMRPRGNRPVWSESLLKCTDCEFCVQGPRGRSASPATRSRQSRNRVPG